MDIFLAGTPVTLTVPLQDAAGNVIEVASVEYRIVKHDGSEVLARAALTDFAGGSEVVVEIPASLNEVAAIDPATLTSDQIEAVFIRESRTVELFLVDPVGNTRLASATYALEPITTLIAGTNSFQTFSQAQLVALDIPALAGWRGAADKDKIAALIEARIRICQLRFTNISEGADVGDLSLVTPLQFGSLTAQFKLALSRAQVVEADAILGGDPVDVRRKEGLILESIGEVKQMFRGGKPLELPVSKRALKYLSPFVSFSQRIGRG